MTMLLLKRSGMSRSTATSSSSRKPAKKPPPAPASNIWSTSTGAISTPRSAWRKAVACAGCNGKVALRHDRDHRKAARSRAAGRHRAPRDMAHARCAPTPSCIWPAPSRKSPLWDPPMRFNDTTRDLLRKARQPQFAPKMPRATKDSSIPQKPPPSANTWPRTSPALTPCCTPRFRPISSGRLSGQRDSVGSRGHARHSRASRTKTCTAFYDTDAQGHRRSRRRNRPRHRAISVPARRRRASIPTRTTPSKPPTRRSMGS